MSESEILEGTLHRIIFKNDTGFVIGAFVDKNRNSFTALGNMINPETGMEYILTGHWQENERYGSQLKFHAYESIMPSDIDGIFKYIVRICKFVGGKTGNEIIDKYGKDTLRMLKECPHIVALDIKGITPQRAKEIQAKLIENEKTEKLTIELETILNVPGMKKSLIGQLIKKYRSNAIEVVKENPYILTSFRGIGFFLADRVALKLGFAMDSIERKKAATVHAMNENMQKGNVWIYKTNLFFAVEKLLTNIPNLAEGVKALIDEGVIIDDSDYYAFSTPALDEILIAEKIINMVLYENSN